MHPVYVLLCVILQLLFNLSNLKENKNYHLYLCLTAK